MTAMSTQAAQADSHRHHISRQFNAELEDVKKHMLEMGGLVERQLADAMAAAAGPDSALGAKVIDADDAVDAQEVSIDEECSLILARRQPAASDLRLVLAIIKTVRDLERMGDESAKIAHAAVKLSEAGGGVGSGAGSDSGSGRVSSSGRGAGSSRGPVTGSQAGLVELRQIGSQVQGMVHSALDAFARYDAETALAVVRRDDEVDKAYGSAIRSLVTYMMEDPRSISRVLDLLWALRALERIGDHAKNISEHVIYLVKGLDVRHEDIQQVADRLADE